MPIAKAQTTALGIVAASELVLRPGMDTPWDISITNTSRETLPEQTVLLIRGLTPEMRISEGRAFGTGVWVISLARISKLKISIPANARKGAILDVSLATLEGQTLARRRLSIVIAPPEVPTSTQSIATTPTPLAQLSPKAREAALLLVQKGDNHMKLGNPLNARQFYLRATESGLPEAAMALGATYDPVELAQYQGIVTSQPDVNLARKWYEKASELGDLRATARIQRLSQR